MYRFIILGIKCAVLGIVS